MTQTKRKCKKAKRLSKEALQIAVERSKANAKEKGKDTQLNAEFQRIVRRDKKAFLNEPCKETEDNNKMEKTQEHFKGPGDIKGTCHSRMGMTKDRNDFPDSSVGTESTCNEGDPSSISGSGRSTGEVAGYPFEYSWASLWLSWESACNVGDLDSIPGLGTSPGEGKGYTRQYSGLENSMDYTVHGVQSQTQLSDFYFHFNRSRRD